MQLLSCWLEMLSQGTRQRRSSWSLTKWIGNRGSILSPAPCCHSAQCGGVCLDMGLELNPLLPWLGSLQRQLFSPYGWDSAPPPLLSNDAFLTVIQRKPLFQEGRSTQYFLGYREKKQGTPPSLNLPVPPCIYMHSLWHHTKMFIHWASSVSLGGTQAAAKIVLQCSCFQLWQVWMQPGHHSDGCSAASSFLLPLWAQRRPLRSATAHFHARLYIFSFFFPNFIHNRER